ncbi:MAG: bifunctional pyr operon transcriptional regulator/uracil phosphoribosyltransferase PyrR [Candidatus Dadabacteria bacterium]|nr:MAG: bifunctional pyr operon transcriptional regulator/uracil phosphoribosyltransferase PyrR [Candidatus Dadabacteria bacterium]
MAHKEVPNSWRKIMDAKAIARSISRISYEIVEKNRDPSGLAVVGIRTGGEHIGRRIHREISRIEGVDLPFGIIDITLYRDDLASFDSQPVLKGTDLPFAITGATIVLVDDVLFTGRTVRAALDAIVDFGRPKQVQLAILVDRGHRELPIRPDFVGKNIPSSIDEMVYVKLEEEGFEDGVYITKS